MDEHITLDSIHCETFSPVVVVPNKKWGLGHVCEGTLKCHDSQGAFTIHFKGNPGACWNGASTPWAFRWLLPNWDDANPVYNLVSWLHDMFYASCGAGIINRDQADDILRGGWRIAGYSRKRASTGEFFVGLFACRHWGRDEYGAAKHFEAYINRESS